MKVLFAVSNENISESIVKKYQKDYKEIISSKNVYYFNAIQKELQKDNTYDRIVISEDLEPFTNNNYDAIDRFIFDKLDAISDEATNSRRNDTPIILICSDRRAKAEDILVKLFSIGIYDAVLGNDRSIDQICKLIRKPRTKKEAKIYYNIDTEDVKYAPENENEVSEVEIQNILNYYKKLGRDEEKYVEGFESIASQYNTEQLKIIANVLPINVKAVLEMSSPTYQKVMTASVKGYMNKEKANSGLSMNFIPDKTKPTGGNIIVPSAVNTKKVRKVKTAEEKPTEVKKEPKKNIEIEPEEKPAPKRRGRPRKNPLPEDTEVVTQETPKRRGRPKKNTLPEKEEVVENEPISLFDLPVNDEKNNEENILPGFEENINEKSSNNEVEDILPGIENSFNEVKQPQYTPNTYGTYNNIENNVVKELTNNDDFEYDPNSGVQGLLTGNKKLVSFVGTSKNGTSFLVNNVAQLISSSGINTAILDTTKNKNSFYIFTQNEEQLRNRASNSIRRLQVGAAEGIKVNNSLTVYTAVPDEEVGIQNYKEVLKTLLENHDLVLIDCDFNTGFGYFAESQEIYLVQSLDVLTIQPLTAFLRDLKAKNILGQEKIKIVINKNMKVRGLTDKAIIGGMSFYNEPSMSFMTELFNRDSVRYCVIPFEEQTYSKYLEGLVNCKISLSGYSKIFMQALKELSNMVYPLVGGRTTKLSKKNTYKPVNNSYKSATFSQGMNDTLNQMKRNY